MIIACRTCNGFKVKGKTFLGIGLVNNFQISTLWEKLSQLGPL